MDPIECRQLNVLTDSAEKCAFINNHTDMCNIGVGYVDYLMVLYCQWADVFALGVVFYVFVFFYVFVVLALAADMFFCPVLVVVSRHIGLGENIAGVTLLAFGNGAVDVLSALVAVITKQGNEVGLTLGELIGAGVFITCVIPSLIAIIRPFHTMQRPFLRDIIFYLAATFWVYIVMWRGAVTIYDSAGLLLLYSIYVIVVAVGRRIRLHLRRKRREPARQDDCSSVNNSDGKTTDTEWSAGHDADAVDDSHPVDEADLVDDPDQPLTMQEIAALEHTENLHGQHGPLDDILLSDDPLIPVESSPSSNAVGRLARDLFDALNPMGKGQWAGASKLGRCWLLVRAPALAVMYGTMPLVDEEAPLRGWSKIRCVLTLLLCLPVLSVLVTYGDGPASSTPVGFYEMGFSEELRVPVIVPVVVASAAVAAVVGATSRRAEEPRWHVALAYAGMVVSCAWIYAMANQLVGLLRTFGVVFDVSQTVLGLTVFAWGNSIQDLLVDTSLARQGCPRMAISACFAGPMFNLMVGIGLPFSIDIIRNGLAPSRFTVSVSDKFLVLFLLISLLASLIFAVSRRFYLNKAYSVVLLFVYLLFLVMEFLTAGNLVRSVPW